MKRKMKLILAIAAALICTAAMATAASAASLEAESYPVTLKTPTPQTLHTLQFDGATTKCTAPSLEATVSAKTKTVSTSTQDSTCEFFGTPKLKMNGCALTYHIGSKLPSGAFKGTFDIGPTGCGPIEFSSPGSFCYVKIGAQSGLPATYENTGAGKERSVKINAQVTNLKYTQASSKCTAGEFSDGGWSGTWTVQGSNAFGRVGVHVESTGPSFGIGGSPPAFVAEDNPTPIVGNSTNTHKMKLQYGSQECVTSQLSSSVPGAASELTVQPTYSNCTAAGIKSTVNMNGCSYTFILLNQEPSGSTYAGHEDIACPAGKAIEIVVSALGKTRCTITIGAQTTDAGGVTFTNEPSTFSVGVGFEVKGIDYHQQEGEGIAKCTTGDFSTGTYTGTSTLTTAL